MVQTRNQKKNSKQVSFSESEFDQLNHNIHTLHSKYNHIKDVVTNMDTKINHVVNEVHYIQQLQKNGYSLNQLYLMMILIGIGFIFFHYGKVSSYFDEIANILSTTISHNYEAFGYNLTDTLGTVKIEDFSTYHTYVFNSTFSEDWFDKLISHPKISEMDLDFYINIQEQNNLI
jgi:hypothetical protein